MASFRRDVVLKSFVAAAIVFDKHGEYKLSLLNTQAENPHEAAKIMRAQLYEKNPEPDYWGHFLSVAGIKVHIEQEEMEWRLFSSKN